jgi:hypothetical protein
MKFNLNTLWTNWKLHPLLYLHFMYFIQRFKICSVCCSSYTVVWVSTCLYMLRWCQSMIPLSCILSFAGINGCGSKDPWLLIFSTRHDRLVIFMLRPLHPQGKSPLCPDNTRSGSDSEAAGFCPYLKSKTVRPDPNHLPTLLLRTQW